MSLTLDSLATEVLIKIFSNVRIIDLCRLKQTCRRFNNIINSWDYALLRNVTPLVTNQRSDIFLSRCSRKLSALEQIRVSRNWHIGRYKEKSLLYIKRKFIPWLCLTDESVWISRGRNISNYKRNKDGININANIVLHGKSKADVGNFQLKNNLLLSGQRDGSLWLASVKEKKIIFDLDSCHRSDINSVDISESGNIVVSGSRDDGVKIWKVNNNLDCDPIDALTELQHINLNDRVWRVSLLKEKTFVGGSTSNPILQLPSKNFGLGVLDLKWDGPNFLWSCGYDTYLKRWDLRTGKCVQAFEDPHASAHYCLDYDYCNTIMTGTQLHGRVILWDIRQGHSLQLYFMSACKRGRYRKELPGL
ncbi:hypothetical protein NQ317_014293 [Molorchus minor]|uniref:F-box domain-containing protein n=1 Tax=Molorchus minor TaxID=1323400 RepID=A0ABQ9JXB3_9CUCU|nr:hypothetical protein NQ317_014293 [Molorchus minor]